MSRSSYIYVLMRGTAIAAYTVKYEMIDAIKRTKVSNYRVFRCRDGGPYLDSLTADITDEIEQEVA